jgi:hypothetical protein
LGLKGEINVGLLGFFSRQDRIPLAVSDSHQAISPQLAAVRAKYSSEQAFEDALASSSILLFIHGFVCYFAQKHGLGRPEYIWAVNVQAFEEAFGKQLGTRLILGLQRALHEADDVQWIEEGEKAARYFDKEKLHLLAAFLERAAQ